jgi:hypothetical protein
VLGNISCRIQELNCGDYLKAIAVGLEALDGLGYSIPFDEASAAALAEQLGANISTDPMVIAVTIHW